MHIHPMNRRDIFPSWATYMGLGTNIMEHFLQGLETTYNSPQVTLKWSGIGRPTSGRRSQRKGRTIKFWGREGGGIFFGLTVFFSVRSYRNFFRFVWHVSFAWLALQVFSFLDTFSCAGPFFWVIAKPPSLLSQISVIEHEQFAQSSWSLPKAKSTPLQSKPTENNVQ